MRYLILSDIHSNNEALQAVCRHAHRKQVDRVLFLGDAVGYGGSPNPVLSWLRSLGPRLIAVRGNHDRVCAGLDDGEYFNRYARQATTWTHERLEPRHLEYLRALPEGPVEVEDGLTICHGSPADEDAYIFSAYDAHHAFDATDARVVFFGHTHLPSAFVRQEGESGDRNLQVRLLAGKRVAMDLEPGNRYMVNPGSVGQPRDRDARAAYAIYDHERGRLRVYRVPYGVALARRRIIQAGLPPVLGDRLLYGA